MPTPSSTKTRLRPASLDEQDAAERMSRDELEALQLTRLQETVRHAHQNVPHYREKLDAAGIHPDDIRSLDDLSRLPFTTKDDLRQNYPFGMFAVPSEEIARVHASSGTTGLPTVVGYTKGDLEIWASLVARSLRASGVRPGMRVHNAYGYGLFTGGLGAHAGIEALGATVIPMSGGQTTRQVQLIRDFQPDVVMSTPSYLMTIADCMVEAGIDPRTTTLKAGVLGAEPWTNSMRGEIEGRLDIDALDIYGLSEVMGPGVANECIESKDGPHIWEDHFLPEIIDSETGARLPDGTEGELVFTSLTKRASPILRYRTRDLSTLLPGTARPGMRRMARITGRNDDMIILRGVNLFPTQIEEIVLGVAPLSTHFVLELTRPARMDELTIRIEPRDDASPGDVEAGVAQLIKIIKIQIGSTVGVIVVAPGTLPRSEGKLKRLYDLRS
jgi:phenylacetate-CoA ligase